MDNKEILRHVDHTLLAQGATWEEIRRICDDAAAYGTASVCIPPSYVKQAKEYLNPISAFILSNLYSNFYALPNFISYEYHNIGSRIIKKLRKRGAVVFAWTIRKRFFVQ